MRGLLIYLGVLACAVALFLLEPQIDVVTSGLFYATGRGFVLKDWPPILFFDRAIPWITWSILFLVAAAAIWQALSGRPLWRLDPKALVFLVGSIAIGPGLFANIILKDHWGRARPAQIGRSEGRIGFRRHRCRRRNAPATAPSFPVMPRWASLSSPSLFWRRAAGCGAGASSLLSALARLSGSRASPRAPTSSRMSSMPVCSSMARQRCSLGGSSYATVWGPPRSCASIEL